MYTTSMSHDTGLNIKDI